MSGLIPDELKVVLERNARALQLRPAIGKAERPASVFGLG